MRVPSLLFAVLIAAAALAPPAARAQTGSGCTPVELADPPRRGYDCGNGLIIEAEAGLLFDLSPEGSPGEVVVEGGGAVLVEFPPEAGEFQIRTPHAIASVRGTKFVVDVTAQVTSVFVIEGSVEVAPADGGAGVLLASGEGIDVGGGEPFVKQRWGADRAEALLARFGR